MAPETRRDGKKGRAERRGEPAGSIGTIVCSVGCCAGCQSCWGYSIGCHQEPCRCDLPCSCDYSREDDDPGWRNGCVRHDDKDDQRHNVTEPDDDDLPDMGEDEAWLWAQATPCPTCGERGPCGYDAEGRALIHLTPREDDDA